MDTTWLRRSAASRCCTAAALDADPATSVIVLVSKPPSPAVAAKVLAAAQDSAKPVVVNFLGADPASITRDGVYGAASLAQAADMAVELAGGGQPTATEIAISAEMSRILGDLADAMAPGQRYVRGIFSGGTFCYEAQLIHRAHGITAQSNTPVAGNSALADLRTSQGHTILDMGDDEFTRGKPHPMIDPSQKDARIRAEIADPATAVVLFDVVLGYGSADDRRQNWFRSSRPVRRRPVPRADRCLRWLRLRYRPGSAGPDQGRRRSAVGRVLVASSNAEAALWSATLATARGGDR